MISIRCTEFKLVEGGSIPIEVVDGEPSTEEVISLIDNGFVFTPSSDDSPPEFVGLWIKGLGNI